MRERMYAITTPEEADRFIESQPIAAVFKAGTCHKTMQGWGNVEKMLRERPEIPVGIIKVVEDRPASNRVAERTQIVHHSPQIILFRNGQPLFELNNWQITLENLEPLFSQHLAEVKVEDPESGGASNLDNYKRLLDAYLGGAVGEPQFTWTYLNMFREDASLRSQEEFTLLNSLFGNPDEHHIHPQAILQFEQENPQARPLRERVQALRAQLDTL
ncbi:monothiol bacilliredoxin BrxC family protein [uncultured Meiothermus sp.]|uniref:monothiol bacilliredoxin BrxC family protein n=1 Tax=uncultured Meiothermus sp. TaxID=157471 RepID=UPI00262192CC|nr:monothiol bacilliredoxin BrxC family protein [uncultured Meiothermus sp.]